VTPFLKVTGAGGRKMKIKTIRLPDVETTMLAELQKVNKTHRDIQGLLISQIQQEHMYAA
jgi:hypothetical protein